jgi:hypothetical protein
MSGNLELPPPPPPIVHEDAGVRLSRGGDEREGERPEEMRELPPVYRDFDGDGVRVGP